MSEVVYPHMFVPAGGRFAESLCAVELFDLPTVDRARELAEIHHGHPLDECLVLAAALSVIPADEPTAVERNQHGEKGLPVSGVIERASHLRAQRSGPSQRLGAPPPGGGCGGR